jgi:hypothetical protein
VINFFKNNNSKSCKSNSNNKINSHEKVVFDLNSPENGCSVNRFKQNDDCKTIDMNKSEIESETNLSKSQISKINGKCFYNG